MVKDYLKEKYKKQGNVFLGLVHRLDKPVSGIVLFGKTLIFLIFFIEKYFSLGWGI